MNFSESEQISYDCDRCIEEYAKNCFDTINEFKKKIQNKDQIIDKFCYVINSSTEEILRRVFEQKNDNIENFIESINCTFDNLLSGEFKNHKDKCSSFLNKFIDNYLKQNNFQNQCYFLNFSQKDICELIKSLLVIYVYYSLYSDEIKDINDGNNCNYIDCISTYHNFDEVFMENIKDKICDCLNVEI